MADYSKKNLKQKLLKNDQMIDDQGKQLNDIERNLKETENIGIAITGNLKDQRVKLENSNETVRIYIFLYIYTSSNRSKTRITL